MDRLVIGTRRYSSWSLRGWLAVRLAGLAVSELVIPLRGGGKTSEIHALSPNGMVPYLEHQGARVWESLALCEYCAEFEPSLLPSDRIARAAARSLASEMHAGFRSLRQAMPMNLGRQGRPLASVAPDLASGLERDIETIDRIWCETRAAFGTGGSFLFGAVFTIPDIMFAPVASRLTSYGVGLSPVADAYCKAVMAYPLMETWRALAEQEPESWKLDQYESIA